MKAIEKMQQIVNSNITVLDEDKFCIKFVTNRSKCIYIAFKDDVDIYCIIKQVCANKRYTYFNAGFCGKNTKEVYRTPAVEL